MLHTIWNVSAEEVSIWVGQVVINCITFWNRTIVYLKALMSLSVVPTRNSVSSKRVATNWSDGGTINFLGLAAITSYARLSKQRFE
jgi:hypothetical protein